MEQGTLNVKSNNRSEHRSTTGIIDVNVTCIYVAVDAAPDTLTRDFVVFYLLRNRRKCRYHDVNV